MILELWQIYLYQPLFNLLIWIYNNFTDQNLGWAIVVMTIMLRLALLPFSVMHEQNRAKNKGLIAEIGGLEADYHDDPILRKQEIRRLLRAKRIKPWANAVLLVIQGLVLVLLYQVFTSGINGDQILDILYLSVDYPGVINTDFFGFALDATHTLFWPGLASVYLFVEIYIDYRRNRAILQKRDLSYFILFPLAIFIVLWFLPMVKALFVITSLVFSTIIHQFGKIVFNNNDSKKEEKPLETV